MQEHVFNAKKKLIPEVLNASTENTGIHNIDLKMNLLIFRMKLNNK